MASASLLHFHQKIRIPYPVQTQITLAIRSSRYTSGFGPSLLNVKNPSQKVRTSAFVCAALTDDYSKATAAQVYKATSGEATKIGELINDSTDSVNVVVFLTHFADLSSWEYAQKLTDKVLPFVESKSNVSLIAVGLGSVENAKLFSETLRFPPDILFADPEGELYKALGFSEGFGKDIEINPYLKLFPMLLGIGSPGTIQEVLRGYLGDRNSKSVFSQPTPFDILGTGYQRPFELATLRLFNMVGILPKWAELSPPKTELLTQQGGTLVFRGTETVYQYKDSGILKYTDVNELLSTLEQLTT